jgi:hypothetical protein
LTTEPAPESGYSRPANGQGFGRSRIASAPDARGHRPTGRYGVADDAWRTFIAVRRAAVPLSVRAAPRAIGAWASRTSALAVIPSGRRAGEDRHAKNAGPTRSGHRVADLPERQPGRLTRAVSSAAVQLLGPSVGEGDLRGWRQPTAIRTVLRAAAAATMSAIVAVTARWPDRGERRPHPGPTSELSTVTRRDTSPVAPRRAASGPYRPAHRPPEDTADLVAQCRVDEPPSWLLSGTLMALGVISLLATSVWLAYHYAQAWLR